MTAPSPAGEPDPRLVALGREVERLARRHSDLDQRQTDLDTLVRCLAEDLALLLPPGGDEDPPALPSWLAAADPVQARAMLTDLAEWLGAVYLRYPDAAASLPECWLWHPDLVEELLWLSHAWTAAYHGPDASVALVGDWHDRYRPGVTRRIKTVAGTCSLENHDPTRSTPTPTVPVEQAAELIATWWATRRDEAAPEPTEAHHTAAAARSRPGGRR